MIVETLPHLLSELTNFLVGDGQFWSHLLGNTPQVDVDLVADVQKAWNHFIECGQVWALLAGLVIGWMVKSILP